MDAQLLQEFWQTFPVTPGHKKAPYLICFDAYIGMGKSTIARAIAELDHSIVCINDEIRTFLRSHHHPENHVHPLQMERLKRLIAAGHSCIYDASLNANPEYKIPYLRQLDCRKYVIRLECPEPLIKQRLDQRTLCATNFSTADFAEYQEVRDRWPRVADELIDFTIQSDQPIEPQVEQFVRQFNLAASV